MGNEKSLIKTIIESILEKKGKEIIQIDLRKLEYAPCDHFLICHGDSATHTRALAEGIEENTEKKLRTKVWHREGFEVGKWVLLDYGSVVVHVFQAEARDYYRLEDLWGDGDVNLVMER